MICPVTRPHELVEAATRAAKQHDWPLAARNYRDALAVEATPEALDGLGWALWWQGDLAGAREQKAQAYKAYKERGDLGAAAWIAMWMANDLLRSLGNSPAAQGWLARSERLIAEAGPCAEAGRIKLLRALAGGDWAALERTAAESMKTAREFGDTDCEILALAYGGLAALVLGRIGEGMAALDEAMVAATSGDVSGPECSGQIYCAMLTACERTVDYRRAAQWSGVAQEFVRQHGNAPMGASCLAFYGSILVATGRWSEAEGELAQALRMFESAAPNMRVDALVRLAALRVRQGRVAEAVRLLDGFEHHQDATLPMAEMHLAAGRHQTAVAMLERRLNQLLESNIERAPVLSLLVESRLSASDLAGAGQAAANLAALSSLAGGDYPTGLALLAAGRVAAADGRDPVPYLDQALDYLDRAGMPWESAKARLETARALSPRNREFAASEARLAIAAFERMGAQPGVDAAAGLLRELGIGGRTGPKNHGVLSRREEEVARLVGLGLSNDEIAGRLFISHRTVEHHVSNILGKLAMSSRAEVAAFAARQLWMEPVLD